MENNNFEEINCYTDASYSKEKSKSVIAYKISDQQIKTIILDDTKNTQTELYGIEFCIKYTIQNYPAVKIINIHTDCQNAWKQNYTIYKNSDNLPIEINLIKIKGHKKMVLMDNKDLIFKQVDKMARKTLRNL